MLPPEELRRLEQAAEWLQRLQDPDAAGVVEAWLDWCAQDLRNQQAFDQIAQAWEATSARASAPPARRRIPWALAAGIVAVLGLALTAPGWLQLRHEGDPPAQVLVSPQGANSRAGLPDGSVLELGGRSEAQIAYSRQWRRVELLGGQMFVTVAPEQRRPFLVEAGALEVVAVGTAFDVRHEAGRTVITVAEGRIEVRGAAGAAVRGLPLALQAGQQLSYVHGTGPLPVRQVDASLGTAWRGGVLGFVDEPLPQVIAIINRYAARQVDVGDQEVAGMTFSGTARVDRIGDWLAALPEALPVTLQELPDGGYMLQARKPWTRSAAAPP